MPRPSTVATVLDWPAPWPQNARRSHHIRRATGYVTAEADDAGGRDGAGGATGPGSTGVVGTTTGIGMHRGQRRPAAPISRSAPTISDRYPAGDAGAGRRRGVHGSRSL